MFKRISNTVVLAATFALLMGIVFYEVIRGHSGGFLILMVFGPMWLLYALISIFFYLLLKMRRPTASRTIAQQDNMGSEDNTIPGGHTVIFIFAVLAVLYTGYHLNVADTFQNCFSLGPPPKDSTLCMLEFPAFIIEIFSAGVILYYIWQSWRKSL
jgi:hypothetical protein